GVQEYMYSATCFLLSMSFAYRLFSLEMRVGKKKLEEIVSTPVVIAIIVLIVLINSPLVPLYIHSTARVDPLTNEYRIAKGLTDDQPIGIVQLLELFTAGVVVASVLSSLLPFLSSVLMRKMTIRKLEQLSGTMSVASKAQHDMLVQVSFLTYKALNLQLLVSACFLLGCTLFFTNLIAIYLFPGFPETTAIVVPVRNL
ncbi:hypothetical protein PMAYCL1PPCAC_03892, partial [Pristionchus mayeri]